MRRLASSTLALALAAGALAATADARPARAVDARSLEVIGGNGSVSIQLNRGVVLGQMDRGRLTINLPRRGGGAGVQVSGAQSTTQPNPRTTVYVGRDLRFSVQGGARVEIRGIGIDASIVGRATIVLRGTGTMKVDSKEPPVSWPEDRSPIGLRG